APAGRRARHRGAVHLPRPRRGRAARGPGDDHARRRGGRAGAGRPRAAHAQRRLHAGADRRGAGDREGAPVSLLACDGIDVRFGDVHAVRGVSLELPEGPFGLGLIGESGSGKSTIARALLGLTPLAGGTVTFEGTDISTLRPADMTAFRRSVQLVMQDGVEALNPRMKVGASVAEGIAAHDLLPRGP